MSPVPYGGEYVCWRCERRFTKPQEYRLVEWYPDLGGMNYRVECRAACDGEPRAAQVVAQPQPEKPQ